MIPLTETAAAVARLEPTMMKKRDLERFNPRASALSSPEANASKERDINKIMIIPIKAIGVACCKCDQLRPEKPPINQVKTECNTSSLKISNNETIADNIVLSAAPASSKAVMDP